jgi:hypothetical protein
MVLVPPSERESVIKKNCKKNITECNLGLHILLVLRLTVLRRGELIILFENSTRRVKSDRARAFSVAFCFGANPRKSNIKGQNVFVRKFCTMIYCMCCGL